MVRACPATSQACSHNFCVVYCTLNALPFLSLLPKSCPRNPDPGKTQIKSHFPEASPDNLSPSSPALLRFSPTLYPTPRWERTPKLGCWWDSPNLCEPIAQSTVLPGPGSKRASSRLSLTLPPTEASRGKGGPSWSWHPAIGDCSKQSLTKLWTLSPPGTPRPLCPTSYALVTGPCSTL